MASTYVVSLVHVQVRVHISLVCTPDSTGHAGPRLLEGEYAFNIVSVNLLARNGINNGRLYSEEG